MKASIKFREKQKPILRAKVPLSILGFTFQSGVEAGDTKELCLSFSTLFESGPVLKFSYRPNDLSRLFSFGIRTGIGHFGSPIGAPMTMNAEFSFLGNGSPSFFLHFRPRIGDFSIKRTVDSRIALRAESSSIPEPKLKAKDNDADSETEEFFENNETPMVGAGNNRRLDAVLAEKRITVIPAASVMEKVFSGTEVCATTALPLKDRAVVKLRWAVRSPPDTAEDRTANFSIRKIPHLVLSKIGIEQVTLRREQDRKLNPMDDDAARSGEPSTKVVRQKLDVLRAESGLLRKDVEELRLAIGAGKSVPATGVRDAGENGEAEKRKQNIESPPCKTSDA